MNASLREALRSYSSLIPPPSSLGLSRSRGRRRGGGGLIAKRLEGHLRRLGRSGYSTEVRLRLEPGEVRHQIRRELDYGGIELLRHLVVSAAFDGDAVFGSFQLRLQLEEILIRLQFGIALNDDEQSRQRVAQAVLRRLELGQGLRIVGSVGLRSRRAARHLHLADAGAGIDDRFER